MNLAPTQVYWHRPQPIFTARVNAPGTILYPVQDIGYDGVTIGSYTNLAADMLVTFGSAEGLDDLGRTRLRAAPTSTVLKIGRASQGTEDGQVDIVDNAWVHVYPDFRVHSKIPTIINYEEFKDTDIPVSDLTQSIPPVAIMGPDRARRIDTTTGLARLFFDGSNSYAVADGATIVSYAWDSQGGTFVLGTGPTDAQVYIDFAAGVRYVSLTVTDSNGKTHTTRRLVLADDPANSLCVSGMQLTNLTRTDKGLSARLRVLQDLPRADYPDGAHVLIFEDRDPAIFGTPDPTDWSDVRFTGWHQVDEASSTAQETHLRRETQLTCVDVLGRLDSLPGFNQRVEVPTAEDLAEDGWNWGYMPAANMDKFQHYLIHWHSTAASVADFFTSGTWANYPFVLFDAVGDTLFNQLARQARRLVPDHNFTSDRYGRMKVVVNPQYQDPADRTSTIHNSVTAQGWSEINLTYNRNPRVHTLRGSAILTGTDYILDGEGNKTVETAFSVAPGTAPGQGGREQKLGERLAQSQAALNSVTGHHYAHLNARYGDITLTLSANADPWDFDPASFTWVQLHTTAATAPQRGLDFTTIRTLCKEVSIDYTYGEEATTWRGRVVLEPETVGLPALTEVHEDALPVGTQPTPFVPPDFGLVEGQQLIAAFDADATNGPLYRTADFQTVSGSGGPTWAQVDLGLADTRVYSFVVDPFSPGYINGTGAINAWIVTEAAVYRVTDVFGATPGVSNVHTFPVALSASSVFQTRTIQASFGRFFPTESDNPWLMVVSHYANAAGHTGTWAIYSLDAGVTWSSEVEITPHFDADMTGDEPRVEVGVYLSPKTPGLAYASAYSQTFDPALVAGYKSEDWGATWTEMLNPADDDPIERQVLWYSWKDNTTLIESHVGTRANLHGSVISNGPLVSASFDLNMRPPKAAVRVDVTVQWSWSYIKTGGLSNPASSITQSEPTFVVDLDTHNFSAPSVPGESSGAFNESFQVTNLPRDFPGNREQAEASPPTGTSSGVVRWRVLMNAQATGVNTTGVVVDITAIVTEIELADGTIYTPPSATPSLLDPGNRPSGTIHVPWLNNDDELIVFSGKTVRGATLGYGTNRAEGDGETITDISPVISARAYGPSAHGFRIRAHDSDSSLVVAGVTGNDTTAATTGNYQAVVVSTDGGATWTEIVAPVNSNAPYAAAWGGTSTQVLFLWGPSAYIAYSSNQGASIDDRAGNLSALGATNFVGIMGGATGA